MITHEEFEVIVQSAIVNIILQKEGFPRPFFFGIFYLLKEIKEELKMVDNFELIKNYIENR